MSWGRYHDTPKLNAKESPDAYEQRTWRERFHTDPETEECVIPPMAFKNMLGEVAKFLSEKIPGKGNNTWTKHFDSGVLCVELCRLGTTKDQLVADKRFVPSNGQAGHGTRVMKYFPLIHKWETVVEFMIVDDTITEEVFERFLREAGNLIGVGLGRPRNRGYYGRFMVEAVTWTEMNLEEVA